MLIVVIMLTPIASSAFVSQLVPYGGYMPCIPFVGAINQYALGYFATPTQVGNYLQARFLTPYGRTWTTQDNQDNARLINAINDIKTNPGLLAANMLNLVLICGVAEDDPAITQTIFLERIGIPRP